MTNSANNPTKRLIVNADDFGMSPVVTSGILAAHAKGIVTSTTVMINYSWAPDLLTSGLKEAPKLGFGLHITLTGGGRPVSPAHSIPTLLSDEGTFPAPEHWRRHADQLNPDEMTQEVHAQYDLFVKTAGRKPDHLDCHHNCLYDLPTIGLPILLALAAEHDLPIRYVPGTVESGQRPMPDHFVSAFYDETATLGDLLNALTTLESGISELMCHPGYVDTELNDPYRAPREAELVALTHKSTREVITAEGIELITFAALHTPSASGTTA